jgi:2-polyprenyl-3-methyl-5-hydroxy-6-metoxy-1,4-benzoquinol methylase
MVNASRFLTYVFRYGRALSFCGRLRRIVTVEWIISYVRAAERILEIGAGDGETICFLAKRFRNKQFIACEQDEKQIARLHARIEKARVKNVTVVEYDFDKYAQNKPFDFIYCVDVLEHILDDYAFLVRICERLRPGGNLFLHVPAPGIDVFEDPDHVRAGYEQDELKALLKKAGFRVVRMEYTFGRRGLRYHHSRTKMSRFRRAIIHLLDMADSEKVRSEIGVIASRAD